MSSTALKIAAVILVLLTLIVAAIGLSLNNNLKERTAKAEAAAARAAEVARTAPQTVAVVALRPLAAYKAIGRDDVALVPVAIVPPNYFGSIDEVVGTTPLVDIDTGAPVTKRYFKEGNLLARNIPAGHQALAVEVNEIIAAGGFVRPGDSVDVIAYFRSGAGVADAQARVLLENALVMAYEERVIERPAGLDDDAAKAGDQQARRRIRTAVLAVPDADTTRIVLGMGLGEIRLALRGQQSATGAEISTDITESGLPLSDEARAEVASFKTPDKAVTAGEISRVQPPPALAKKAPSPPPRNTVEVIQGNKIEKVDQ